MEFGNKGKIFRKNIYLSLWLKLLWKKNLGSCLALEKSSLVFSKLPCASITQRTLTMNKLFDWFVEQPGPALQV